MKQLIFAAAFIIVSGCASQTVILNSEKLPMSSLATVKTEGAELFGDPYQAPSELISITSAEGKQLFKSTLMGGSPSEVKLPVGTYIFVIKCNPGNMYNFNRITADIPEAAEYTAFCAYKTGQNILGVGGISDVKAFVKKSAEAQETKLKHRTGA